MDVAISSHDLEPPYHGFKREFSMGFFERLLPKEMISTKLIGFSYRLLTQRNIYSRKSLNYNTAGSFFGYMDWRYFV